jgi:hypothetical protein
VFSDNDHARTTNPLWILIYSLFAQEGSLLIDRFSRTDFPSQFLERQGSDSWGMSKVPIRSAAYV